MALWLIAEREFRAYVATFSFWVALLLGPVFASAGLLAVNTGMQPTAISVVAADKELGAEAGRVIGEVAHLEERKITLNDGSAVVARLEPTGGRIKLSFVPDFPLSAAGRALVAKTLDYDRLKADALRPASGIDLVEPPPPKHGAPLAGGPRFAVMMMLWLTLTGSLGMLLQALVRERANRALEMLLASCRPWQIVLGKVCGVGMVSMLVLATWLAPLVIAAAGGWAGPELRAALATVAAPGPMLRAVLIYILGFAFYGLVTVGLGAGARDSATAQNLSRPMFAILLVAFFGAMLAGNHDGTPWLDFFPPFTPFLLLMRPPSMNVDAPALILLTTVTVVAGWTAINRLQIIPAAPLLRLTKLGR